MDKLQFKGTIQSIQPRIRLTRSFDESSHSYLGYTLKIKGIIDDAGRDFSIGIGKVAHAKHQFKAGDEVSGECLPVAGGNHTARLGYIQRKRTPKVGCQNLCY